MLGEEFWNIAAETVGNMNLNGFFIFFTCVITLYQILDSSGHFFSPKQRTYIQIKTREYIPHGGVQNKNSAAVRKHE